MSPPILWFKSTAFACWVTGSLSLSQVGEECLPPGRWPDEFSNPKFCGARDCLLCMFDLVGGDVLNLTRDGRDATRHMKDLRAIPNL